MKTRLIAAVAAMLVAGVALGLTSGLTSGQTSAQTYPSKPIRIIPGQPGGNGDVMLRFMREPLASRLGQPVIADYRAATVMGGVLARSEPDGYTLMIAGTSVWIGEKMDYDTLRDFAAVASLNSSPAILVINPSLPVNSVKELIAYAKARPGTLNYASGATGSTYHLGGELLKIMAGIDIVRVNYTGAVPITQAVVRGESHMTFGSASSVAPLIKSGKLKPLAHTGADRSALAPDLPTMAAAGGLPGYEVTSGNGMFAPIKTPAAIVRRLNQDINSVLALEDVKEKMLGLGLEAGASTPEEFAARVKHELAYREKLMKDSSISTN